MPGAAGTRRREPVGRPGCAAPWGLGRRVPPLPPAGRPALNAGAARGDRIGAQPSRPLPAQPAAGAEPSAPACSAATPPRPSIPETRPPRTALTRVAEGVVPGAAAGPAVPGGARRAAAPRSPAARRCHRHRLPLVDGEGKDHGRVHALGHGAAQLRTAAGGGGAARGGSRGRWRGGGRLALQLLADRPLQLLAGREAAPHAVLDDDGVEVVGHAEARLEEVPSVRAAPQVGLGGQQEQLGRPVQGVGGAAAPQSRPSPWHRAPSRGVLLEPGPAGRQGRGGQQLKLFPDVLPGGSGVRSAQIKVIFVRVETGLQRVELEVWVFTDHSWHYGSPFVDPWVNGFRYRFYEYFHQGGEILPRPETKPKIKK